MVRSLTSVGMAVVLMIAVMSAACFACAPASMPMSGDCCKHHKCPKSTDEPKADCDRPVDTFVVEKLIDHADFTAPLTSVAYYQIVVEPVVFVSPPIESPPDVRILTSSLTI